MGQRPWGSGVGAVGRLWGGRHEQAGGGAQSWGENQPQQDSWGGNRAVMGHCGAVMGCDGELWGGYEALWGGYGA